MSTINRTASLKQLTTKQREIRYESSEDEGAAEYHGEIQSVIDSITDTASDKQIEDAAEWVGQLNYLIYEAAK